MALQERWTVFPETATVLNMGRGRTATRKLLKSLSGGWPLSVTRTVMLFVEPANVSSGVHVKTPVDGFMPAPVGAPGSRLKVRVLGWISESVACLVRVRVLSTWMH